MDLKHSEDYFIRILLNKIKLEEIMISPVTSLNVHAPFSQVEERMRTHNIRHLPIINDHNELVGLMTQRDLYRIHPPRQLIEGTWYYDKAELDTYNLAQLMIANPFTLRRTDSAATALLAMAEKKYGCIPIVDDEKLTVVAETLRGVTL